jgi:type II secretory pathway component GspD/PulD (secretin)
MKATGKILLILCAIAARCAVAADLVVIDLHNRTANEVLPSLRPLVGPDVALSGVDYKLLVRGSAADVEKIREVLAVLDRAPRQLLISVRYGGNPQSKSSELGAAANIDNRGAQVTVHGDVTTRTVADSNTSSVRVLEGNSAHISTGQSVPVITAFVPTQFIGKNSTIGIATDYRELSSGFTVLPRVNSDRVVLEVSTQQQRLLDSNAGVATTQRASTTIAGRLGEWIELGGVTSTAEEQHSTVGIAGGARRVSTQSDARTIAVKVEQVQ